MSWPFRRSAKSIGFLKPIGQQQVQVAENVAVDKDVVLFKEYFKLQSSYPLMSPILCPGGFTRNFLDQKIDPRMLWKKVHTAWDTLSKDHEFLLLEGTGHVGVGSIFQLNNARIAKELGLDIAIIATGGLGSAFDELALNLEMCASYGVRVRGVILNKVLPEKRAMILEYFPKCLKALNIPLLGCIPFLPFLADPCIKDFESLFRTTLLSGERHRWRHFQNIRLVAGSLDSYLEEMRPRELVITPACREDIILATQERYAQALQHNPEEVTCGLILTGKTPPNAALHQQLKSIDIPVLYAPLCSYDVMKMITSFTAKIRKEDTPKVEQAIQLVEKEVNFELLTATGDTFPMLDQEQ
jgi:phosphate acetyltransferase